MALLHPLENLRLALQVENFHILTGRQANLLQHDAGGKIGGRAGDRDRDGFAFEIGEGFELRLE